MNGLTSARGWFLALPYVFYAGVVMAALAWSGNRPAQTLLLAVAFGVLQLLGLLFSLRAATHPRLSAVDRRPWLSQSRYLARDDRRNALIRLVSPQTNYADQQKNPSPRHRLPLTIWQPYVPISWASGTIAHYI